MSRLFRNSLINKIVNKCMVDDNYAKCLNAPSTSTHGWLRMLAWGASRDQPKPCSNLFKIVQYLPGMGYRMEVFLLGVM